MSVRRPQIGVIVPARDEAENMEDLIDAVEDAAIQADVAVELVIVDDGSSDGTALAAVMAAGDRPIRVVRHRFALGKTAAIVSGAEASVAPVLVVLDADLQYAPNDAIRLARIVTANDADVVSGRRVGVYEKATVSRIFNTLARWVFRVPVRDLNGLVTLKREVLLDLPLRHEWHRYMVALAYLRGWRVAERDVPLYPRHAGHSKYASARRIGVGVLDLVAVAALDRAARKPLAALGEAGIVSLTFAGSLIGLAAFGRLLHVRSPVGYHLPVLAALVLVVAAVVLVLAGVAFELASEPLGPAGAAHPDRRWLAVHNIPPHRS